MYLGPYQTSYTPYTSTTPSYGYGYGNHSLGSYANTIQPPPSSQTTYGNSQYHTTNNSNDGWPPGYNPVTKQFQNMNIKDNYSSQYYQNQNQNYQQTYNPTTTVSNPHYQSNNYQQTPQTNVYQTNFNPQSTTYQPSNNFPTVYPGNVNTNSYQNYNSSPDNYSPETSRNQIQSYQNEYAQQNVYSQTPNRPNTPQETSHQVLDSQNEFFLQQLQMDHLSQESKSRKEEIEQRKKDIEAKQKELEDQKQLLEEHQKSIRENIEKERQLARERALLCQRELDNKKEIIMEKEQKLKIQQPTPIETKPNDIAEKDTKAKESLYSCIIDNVRSIASNMHRILNLVLNQYDSLMNSSSDEYSLFKDVLEYLKSVLKRLNQILNDSILNIDDNLHNQLSTSSRNLRHSTKSVIELCSNIIAPNKSKFTSENLKSSIKQSCVAVSFSIKQFIEDLESLKVSEGLNHLNIPVLSMPTIEQSEQVVTEALANQAEATQPKEPMAKQLSRKKMKFPKPAKYDPSKYPQSDIVKVQELIRRWVLQHRFLKIIEDWKNSKDSNSLRTRYRVLFEIKETELRYIESLELFIRFYYDECVKNSKQPNPCITKSQIDILFQSILDILSFSKSLYQEMERRLSKWPSVQLFGDIFIDNSSKMIMYADYINGFDEALSLYTSLKSKPEFVELERSCINASKSRMDFPSFLIMPVQRLPRYQLLLRELIKNTSPDHIDYNTLNDAKDKITNINIEVNKRKREYDNKMIINNISKQVMNAKGFEFWKPERLFIGEIFASVHVTNEKYYGHIYLFNDYLVLCKSSKKGGPPPYTFVEALNLTQIGVVVDHSSWRKKYLKLYNTSGTSKNLWKLSFSGEEVLTQWHKNISETIETAGLRNMLTENIGPSNNTQALIILSATYGDLSNPKFCIDVTRQLQSIIESSGGKVLNLPSKSKSSLPGFVDPIKGKRKSILIVYTVSGVIKTRTFEDEEEVKIQ